MAISIGFSSNEGSGPILPVGQWPCVLKSVKVVEQRKYQSDEMEEKLQFTFESLKPVNGEIGLVSVWTGLNYGGSKAKLTELLDQIFGRPLTQEEARAMDLEALAGAIKGYVQVMPHTKMDGTKTTKFGAFIPREGAELPKPSDFPLGALTISPSASRGAALPSMAPANPPDWDDAEGEDIGDPFAEDNDKRTSAQQGHNVRRAA
jgi:hypothetical protein